MNNNSLNTFYSTQFIMCALCFAVCLPLTGFFMALGIAGLIYSSIAVLQGLAFFKVGMFGAGTISILWAALFGICLIFLL